MLMKANARCYGKRLVVPQRTHNSHLADIFLPWERTLMKSSYMDWLSTLLLSEKLWYCHKKTWAYAESWVWTSVSLVRGRRWHLNTDGIGHFLYALCAVLIAGFLLVSQTVNIWIHDHKEVLLYWIRNPQSVRLFQYGVYANTNSYSQPFCKSSPHFLRLFFFVVYAISIRAARRRQLRVYMESRQDAQYEGRNNFHCVLQPYSDLKITQNSLRSHLYYYWILNKLALFYRLLQFFLQKQDQRY